MKFYEQLRKLISDLGITQERAARLLHVSRNTLEYWLADPETWGREPDYLTKCGIKHILMNVLHRKKYFEKPENKQKYLECGKKYREKNRESINKKQKERRKKP